MDPKRCLELSTMSARSISAEHRKQLDAERHRVHVRPTASGLTLVSILHETSQVGEAFTHIDKLIGQLGATYDEPRRKTPEKQLQSALIRNAHANERHLDALEKASERTNEPVQLLFVNDELAMSLRDGGRIVCDVLALRVDGGRSRPVLLELKSSRDLNQLIKQVVGYSTLLEEHRDLFAAFYGAILGRDVHFDDGPPETWIVWPEATGHEKDPREEELRVQGIRVVSYVGTGPEYSFRVGDSVKC